MYILSPSRDSKEVRDFLQKWNSNDQRLFSNAKNGKDFAFPLQNLVSICTLLVWQPSNASDNITRLLFPGSTPQHKIFEGLDRLKQLECTKYPVCSAKTLNPNIVKTKKIEKIIQHELKIKTERVKIESKIEELIKNGESNGVRLDSIITDKNIKKRDSVESDKSGPLDAKKPDEIILTNGKLVDEKIKPKAQRAKIESKTLKATPKIIERKPKLPQEKKVSPTTPKKVVDVSKLNGEATVKHKPPIKFSPSSTPAKSAKDANNRQVVESKQKVPKKEQIKPDKKSDRKPISRRPKGLSPAGLPESPIKKPAELHKLEARKPKLEKECTTDSSTVSTPTTDLDSVAKKDLTKLTPEEIDQLKANELAELKEEQEVVKEIEAVFRKSEINGTITSDARKIKSISLDEKTDGEEYLIIEKEEVDHDSLDEKDDKESETQKHLRDSEESEKPRKLSSDLKTPEVAKIPEEPAKEKSASPEDRIDLSSAKKDAPESHADEKYPTPIESGATTAPTLPEDERIPLDEIKEDVIEEKHVKEDTKEKDVEPPAEAVAKLPVITGIKLDKQTPIRDLIKTPDEVADLPVHEEVDIENYEQFRVAQQSAELSQPNRKTKSPEEHKESPPDKVAEETLEKTLETVDVLDKKSVSDEHGVNVEVEIVKEVKEESHIIKIEAGDVIQTSKVELHKEETTETHFVEDPATGETVSKQETLTETTQVDITKIEKEIEHEHHEITVIEKHVITKEENETIIDEKHEVKEEHDTTVITTVDSKPETITEVHEEKVVTVTETTKQNEDDELVHEVHEEKLITTTETSKHDDKDTDGTEVHKVKSEILTEIHEETIITTIETNEQDDELDKLTETPDIDVDDHEVVKEVHEEIHKEITTTETRVLDSETNELDKEKPEVVTEVREEIHKEIITTTETHVLDNETDEPDKEKPEVVTEVHKEIHEDRTVTITETSKHEEDKPSKHIDEKQTQVHEVVHKETVTITETNKHEEDEPGEHIETLDTDKKQIQAHEMVHKENITTTETGKQKDKDKDIEETEASIEQPKIITEIQEEIVEKNVVTCKQDDDDDDEDEEAEREFRIAKKLHEVMLEEMAINSAEAKRKQQDEGEINKLEPRLVSDSDEEDESDSSTFSEVHEDVHKEKIIKTIEISKQVDESKEETDKDKAITKKHEEEHVTITTITNVSEPEGKPGILTEVDEKVHENKTDITTEIDKPNDKRDERTISDKVYDLHKELTEKATDEKKPEKETEVHEKLIKEETGKQDEEDKLGDKAEHKIVTEVHKEEIVSISETRHEIVTDVDEEVHKKEVPVTETSKKDDTTEITKHDDVTHVKQIANLVDNDLLESKVDEQHDKTTTKTEIHETVETIITETIVTEFEKGLDAGKSLDFESDRELKIDEQQEKDISSETKETPDIEAVGTENLEVKITKEIHDIGQEKIVEVEGRHKVSAPVEEKTGKEHHQMTNSEHLKTITDPNTKDPVHAKTKEHHDDKEGQITDNDYKTERVTKEETVTKKELQKVEEHDKSTTIIEETVVTHIEHTDVIPAEVEHYKTDFEKELEIKGVHPKISGDDAESVGATPKIETETLNKHKRNETEHAETIQSGTSEKDEESSHKKLGKAEDADEPIIEEAAANLTNIPQSSLTFKKTLVFEKPIEVDDITKKSAEPLHSHVIDNKELEAMSKHEELLKKPHFDHEEKTDLEKPVSDVSHKFKDIDKDLKVTDELLGQVGQLSEIKTTVEIKETITSRVEYSKSPVEEKEHFEISEKELEESKILKHDDDRDKTKNIYKDTPKTDHLHDDVKAVTDTEEDTDTKVVISSTEENVTIFKTENEADKESLNDSLGECDVPRSIPPLDFVDKFELGRKSPKEREQDVAKIVASVAEVLKSDAPLEEFEGKLPVEVVSFVKRLPEASELRETHITTADSLASADGGVLLTKDPVSLFLEAERTIGETHIPVESKLKKIESAVTEQTPLTNQREEVPREEAAAPESKLNRVIEKSAEEQLVSDEKPEQIGGEPVVEQTILNDQVMKDQSPTPSKQHSIAAFLDKEREVAETHSVPNEQMRISSLIKDSTELIQATSKIISDIKQSSSSDVPDVHISLETSDKIPSRKSTPELVNGLDIDKDEGISDVSGKITPEPQSTEDTPVGPPEIKEPKVVETSTILASATPENSSPDLLDPLDTSKSPSLSGKSTPDIIIHEVKDLVETPITGNEYIAAFLEAEQMHASNQAESSVLADKTDPDSGRASPSSKFDSTPGPSTYPKDSSRPPSPGTKTPPTVPVSPIVKDKIPKTDKGSEVLVSKLSDALRSSTPASDDCDLSSGQVSRVLTTEDDDKVVYSDDDLSAASQIPHSISSQYDLEESVRGLPVMDPMSTSFYGALPDDPESEEGSASHLYEITSARFSSPHVQENIMTASFIGSELPEDPIAGWGKPLGLPSPAPLNDNKGTPKKERKVPANVVAKNKINEDKKVSDAKYDKKAKKIVPVYVDLTYVPHHGNSNYSYIDFFKRIRARYYVFSGTEPSKDVYNALLEAKQTWDDKELEVTIIPTYDTDVLGYWVAENEELLAKHKIDLSPSASRCTINLQDHETSCSAYRLEFC